MATMLNCVCKNVVQSGLHTFKTGSINTNLARCFSALTLNENNRLKPSLTLVGRNKIVFYQPSQPATTSFFNKLPAEQIWKGVTSVSNAGKKRGRGRGAGKKVAKNLNRGQVIGVGKTNMMWPGLNSPVFRGKELVRQQRLPDDPEREAKLLKIRNEMGTFRRLKLDPSERGWSGNKMPGRSIGPPDPIGEDKFEGFDTKVLELKSVFNMTGNMGRKRRISVCAVTGNGQGLGGFGFGKAIEPKSALTSAKNRAGQKLMYIERYNNHTVYHDFFTQFGKTKIFVNKMNEGYGLKCHRAIKAICEIIGIKDLHAKIEGPTNLQHIVKAFFLGLLQQKTHEQLAEETSLHLVEFRKENSYCPRVVASPSVCKTNVKEAPDFLQHVMNDKVVLKKKKKVPFYWNSFGHQLHLYKAERRRNHDKVRINLKAEYGELRSFLAEQYPECVAPRKKNATTEKEIKEVDK